MIWVDMTIGSSHSEVFFKIGIGKVGKILSYDPNGHFIILMIIIIIIIIYIKMSNTTYYQRKQR